MLGAPHNICRKVYCNPVGLGKEFCSRVVEIRTTQNDSQMNKE
jgi:hypothetical protein